MLSTNKKTVWVIIFSVAMGLLESAVVIYLRELYYPDGFRFPLKIIPADIGRVEVYREAATLIMLIALGILAGKSKLQRFAYFVLAFAIWDLSYYLFLYLFINWPPSLFTWDILFLIPVPWIGPVWAPCLLCLLMTAGSVYVINKSEDPLYRIDTMHWVLMIGGACFCIFSFMWDYLLFTANHADGWSFSSSQDLFKDLEAYIPATFHAGLFFTGFLLMCTSIFLNIYKTHTHENS